MALILGKEVQLRSIGKDELYRNGIFFFQHKGKKHSWHRAQSTKKQLFAFSLEFVKIGHNLKVVKHINGANSFDPWSELYWRTTRCYLFRHGQICFIMDLSGTDQPQVDCLSSQFGSSSARFPAFLDPGFDYFSNIQVDCIISLCQFTPSHLIFPPSSGLRWKSMSRLWYPDLAHDWRFEGSPVASSVFQSTMVQNRNKQTIKILKIGIESFTFPWAPQ